MGIEDLVECPLECGAKISDENSDEHLNVCQKALVNCELCSENIVRENLTSHINSKIARNYMDSLLQNVLGKKETSKKGIDQEIIDNHYQPKINEVIMAQNLVRSWLTIRKVKKLQK